MLLWAKKIFKTKPNNEISQSLKGDIKTIFHHLTKEELVDKLVANYVLQHKKEEGLKNENSKKRNNNI